MKTKAMRLGVGALTIVGTLGFGTFAGCSSSGDDTVAPVDTDSGTAAETTPPDSTTTDTGSKPDSATSETPPDTNVTETSDADAGPAPPDRRINVLFARPDEPPLYVCLGVFIATPVDGGVVDPSTKSPIGANGPFGIPNDPKDPTKGLKSGFPYGFGFGVTIGPADAAAAPLSSPGLQAVGYFLETDPGITDPKACEKAWDSVKGDRKRWFAVPPATAKANTSSTLALVGCKAPSATGECGAATSGDSRDFVLAAMDFKDPTTFTGGGTKKFGVQFMNLTQFAGVAGAVPSFQNVDVYIQPMNAPTSDAGADADGGTATPAGTPIPIAGVGGATGVSYKDLITPAVGVALGGDPNEAIFLLTPHGTAPCTPGTAGCATIPIPARPYLDLYGPTLGGGFTGNQVFALMGTPIPVGTAKPKLIIEMLPTKF